MRFETGRVGVPPHQPHRWTPRNADLFQHLEPEPIVERQVLGFLGLEVGRFEFPVTPVQDRFEERTTESRTLAGRIDAEQGEIPVRFGGMFLLDRVEQGQSGAAIPPGEQCSSTGGIDADLTSS